MSGEGESQAGTIINEDRASVEEFKRAIKDGLSVNKALEVSGLSNRKYQRYYEEIWSDPELADLKPEPLFPNQEDTGNGEENGQRPKTEEKGEEVAGDGETNDAGDEKVEGRGEEPPETPTLDKLTGLPTKPPEIGPDEAYTASKYWEEWFKERYGRLMRGPTTPGGKLPSPEELAKLMEEERKRAKEILEKSGYKVVLAGTPTNLDEAKKIVEESGYKLVEADKPTTIEEAKKILESMGYKVMDGRITLEEAEKRVAEERAKWEQEIDLEKEKSLEESKIGAATQVVTHAIDKVMEPFTYFLKKWFEGTIEGRARAEAAPNPQESLNPGSVAVQAPTVEARGNELRMGSLIRYTHTGKKSAEKVRSEPEEEG
jgi:DNA-binding transcriptional regulator YhcF (GntR family)